MRSGLRAAVDNLYVVFGPYPLIEDVEYCTHCVDPEQVVALHRSPLRQITADQLGPLLFNSTTTWGDQRYLNHFLPRLLELVVAGDMDDWSYNVFLPGRLKDLWWSGSDDERSAIRDFAWAWWQETMSTWPSACEVGDVLDTIVGCGADVSPYLTELQGQVGEPVARQLAELVSGLLFHARQDNDFWREVDDWLAGPIPANVLVAGVSATADPDVARQLSDAYDSLALWRQTRSAAAGR
ncbi:hypothetical protein AB0A95_26215 [Micromonospora sp. NPDC049230]|uniref:hypothetical protein n=1 Tax=Micromonospora sp. NPDC049230 TaxID=3155502 RepID=UPI0033C4CFC6